MHKICPQCHQTFEAQFLCPNCGIQLLDAKDRSATMSADLPADPTSGLSLARRLVAGLVLSQGAYIGLGLLGSAFEVTPDRPASGSAMFWVLLGVQWVAVFAGGLVAGTGNPSGWVAGLAVGFINAAALLASHLFFSAQPPELLVLLAWMSHAVVGALGGRLGQWYWPSVHDLPDPTTTPAKPEKKVKVEKPKEAPIPVAWLRVLGGSALAVGSTVWAGSIRDSIIGHGHGMFVLESRLQGFFIAWAISALAMLVGGAFAAASTRAGLKHGFLVSLFSCAGIFMIHQYVVPEALPAEQFFAATVGLAEHEAANAVQLGLFLLTNTLIQGTLGGWIGGLLLPRLADHGPSALDRGAI